MQNKEISSNEFFKKIRMDSKRFRGRGIDLTFKCNNNCIFCYDQLRRKKIEEKSLEQAKSEVIQLKNQGHGIIALRGSEPTIYPYIFELIQFLREHDLEFRLTTNARLFSYKKIAKTFVEMGLRHVYTSLHSNKAKVHDDLTRVPGGFKQIVKGIKNLLKYGVMVETNTTILKQNVRQLKEIAQFLSKKFNKLFRVRFSSLYHEGVDYNIGSWRKIMPPIQDIRENLTEAMDILREHNIYSFIEKLPVCGAPNYYLDFKPEDYIIRANQKPQICASCKYFNNDYCVGVSPVYLKLYGEKDLIPQ